MGHMDGDIQFRRRASAIVPWIALLGIALLFSFLILASPW
jgi:hypothetical protein